MRILLKFIASLALGYFMGVGVAHSCSEWFECLGILWIAVISVSIAIAILTVNNFVTFKK